MEKKIMAFELNSGKVLVGELIDGQEETLVRFPMWLFQEVNNGQLMHRMILAAFPENDHVILKKQAIDFEYIPNKDLEKMFLGVVDDILKKRIGIVIPGNFNRVN